MQCCIDSTEDNGLTGAALHWACWIGFPSHERLPNLDTACSFEFTRFIVSCRTIFAMKKEKVTW